MCIRDRGIIALKRDHGGVSLSYSLKTYEKEKRLIAREAVKLVEDKSTIFLSSASTTMFMIPLLARKNKLTIITDGLEHALKAASLGIKTICIGGVVIPSGKTASGLLAEEMLLSLIHISISINCDILVTKGNSTCKRGTTLSGRMPATMRRPPSLRPSTR